MLLIPVRQSSDLWCECIGYMYYMCFVKGICMIIGGLKHAEQKFNSRTAGVSSALLFVSVAGAYAPSLFALSYPPAVVTNTTCMVGFIA